MAYYYDEFDGLTLPAGQEDDNPAEAAGDFLPLWAGQYDANQSAQTFHRGMEVTKKAVVYDASQAPFISTIRSLRAKTGHQGKLYRQWGDGSREWAYARLLGVSGQKKTENKLHQELTFRWAILSRIWYSESETEVTAELTDLTTNITLTNNGNAPVRNAIITVDVPASFPAAAALVVSKSGQSEFQYTGAISPGSQLQIDCGAKAVKLDSVDSYDNFSLTSNHVISEWLRLDPGDNILSVTLPALGGGMLSPLPVPFVAEATGVTSPVFVTVTFYDGWR
jgi:hypothetical protein